MTQNAHERQFEREKFAVATCENFLAWRKDRQVRFNFSNDAKIAELRRHFFADIDALEKTGETQRALALAVSAVNGENSALARH